MPLLSSCLCFYVRFSRASYKFQRTGNKDINNIGSTFSKAGAFDMTTPLRVVNHTLALRLFLLLIDNSTINSVLHILLLIKTININHSIIDVRPGLGNGNLHIELRSPISAILPGVSFPNPVSNSLNSCLVSKVTAQLKITIMIISNISQDRGP
eukprot:TRINITY_DN14313_c0_g1_i2.p1 TRINITY_DN14313_c0_g1~~TRINITY_DN14313_c0_g1_i2.p1  ORF type:complete len:154 (-),score=9.86 TRINITY_DN14313_c0_g1_i2:1382-1843(-)